MALATAVLLTGGFSSAGQGALTASPIAVIPFTVTFSTTAYATASGGILVDLSGVIRTPPTTPSSTSGYYGAGYPNVSSTRVVLEAAEILTAFGFYSGGDTVIPTKSATYGQFTVRLFNGETETADGNKTGTLTFFVVASLGSRSFQST